MCPVHPPPFCIISLHTLQRDCLKFNLNCPKNYIPYLYFPFLSNCRYNLNFRWQRQPETNQVWTEPTSENALEFRPVTQHSTIYYTEHCTNIVKLNQYFVLITFLILFSSLNNLIHYPAICPGSFEIHFPISLFEFPFFTFLKRH